MATANRWMTRDLINDHHYEPTEAKKTEKTFIGLRWHSNSLPALVACGRPGYQGTLCLNKVYEDKHGQMHLSTCATWTLTREQLAHLHETGKLDCGNYHFRLIPEEGLAAMMEATCDVCDGTECTCTPS